MKSAVVVGINAYPNAPLSGCVNDANDWAELLASHGYTSTVLLDSTATKANICAALAHAVADARFGDRIVFTYSGHGTWLPDQNGDEPDGRDEALCAYDYEQGGLIVDDELSRIFANKRWGVRVTVISDSCHSGTVSRFADTGRRPTFSKPRFISPFDFLQGEDLERAKKAMVRVQRTKPVSSSTVLFAGCGDVEYSYDAWFNGRANGAFTRAAINVLEAAAVPLNYRRWHSAIRALLPTDDYPQSPQLTATAWQRTWKL